VKLDLRRWVSNSGRCYACPEVTDRYRDNLFASYNRLAITVIRTLTLNLTLNNHNLIHYGKRSNQRLGLRLAGLALLDRFRNCLRLVSGLVLVINTHTLVIAEAIQLGVIFRVITKTRPGPAQPGRAYC
jgi:hypothetical protein